MSIQFHDKDSPNRSGNLPDLGPGRSSGQFFMIGVAAVDNFINGIHQTVWTILVTRGWPDFYAISRQGFT